MLASKFTVAASIAAGSAGTDSKSIILPCASFAITTISPDSGKALKLNKFLKVSGLVKSFSKAVSLFCLLTSLSASNIRTPPAASFTPKLASGNFSKIFAIDSFVLFGIQTKALLGVGSNMASI